MSKPIHAPELVAAIWLALSGQAFAHAHLVSATPPVGGTVATSPTELDLRFSEALNLKFSGVKVTGPDEAELTLEEPMLMDDDTTFMAMIASKLAPGTYSVEWHALSSDGHKTQGSYTFVVKP